MSRPTSTLERSLRVLVAVLALLCGTGVHEALHEFGSSRVAQPPSAPFEAHDSGCPHRGDVPLHDQHSCVICKSGGTRHAALPQCGPQAAPLFALRILPLAVDALALPAPTPGSIGARAPPVSVG